VLLVGSGYGVFKAYGVLVGMDYGRLKTDGEGLVDATK